jgi:hypothetical protein
VTSEPSRVAERGAPANEPRVRATISEAQTRRPNERKNGAFGRPALAFLVLALPALWVGWLIYTYGVDTPWADQWSDTRAIFERMQAGTLAVSDFTGFHNEHRILFPRLLTFALAHLTHWNVRAELLANWLLLCLCSLNLWRVAQITGWRDSTARHWLLLGANVLLFSSLQFENLLWGFQLGFFVPLATTTACLWVAPSFRRPFDFLATMLLCFMSNFSIASGFACWLFTAPLLLLWNGKAQARHEKLWWSLWSSVAVISTCSYFRGYARPRLHPSPLEAFHHPLKALEFALDYLGNPFCSGTVFERTSVATVAGATLLLAWMACLIYLWCWRRDRALLAQSLPWLSLTAITLVNALLSTVGRFGFGMKAAIQSRYISFAVMLPIGLLFLVPVILRHWRQRSRASVSQARLTTGFVSLVTAFALLFLGATIHSIEFWQSFQHGRLTGKAALLLVNVLDEPDAIVRWVHWSHWTIKDWANNMDRLGYMHPPLVRSSHVRELAADTNGETMGEISQFTQTADGELTIGGWGILPGGHRIADSVLLTADDANGEPIIFARVDVRVSRPDISERLHDDAYFHSGWLTSCKPETIPRGARLIRAWTFDADAGHAFLIGSAMM